jgi:hypothetical protein
MLKYAALLLRHFFLLTCFKRNPQDLPASDAFLAIIVPVYLLTGSLHNSIHETFFRSSIIGILDILFLVFFVYLVLKMFNYPQRWSQTVTAMAGSGIILTLFAVPVSLGLVHYQDGSLYMLLAFLMLFLFAWSLCVHAHILRHALELPFNAGFIFAFVYNLLSFMVIGTLLQIQGTA